MNGGYPAVGYQLVVCLVCLVNMVSVVTALVGGLPYFFPPPGPPHSRVVLENEKPAAVPELLTASSDTPTGFNSSIPPGGQTVKRHLTTDGTKDNITPRDNTCRVES